MGRLLPSSRAVSTKPMHAKAPPRAMVRRVPSRLASRPPPTPPRQKKHMVRVKFMVSWEAFQPNASASGAFSMDQL
ncbi:Uncharacterised protein [Flavonifractor plautii]|uniref:Uncharacterized protein n=1 Tax=Flavonifractor plautii TaxID=292800 RepID=A0A173ZSS9_FLAPL|nr:Uncharacterised protein [Flavonifractor plautii]